MEKTRVSYEIHNNGEDFFLPFLFETKIDGKVVSRRAFRLWKKSFKK